VMLVARSTMNLVSLLELSVHCTLTFGFLAWPPAVAVRLLGAAGESPRWMVVAQ
jgi:hypothetical protein